MQLASAGTPDPAGQPFSMSPGFGSMALDLAGGKQGWITAAVNIGVYNPKTATCGTICVDCCGYTYATMDPTAADVAPGAQTSFIVNAEDCNGNTHNISAAYQPLWGTDNANVATPADNGHPAATGFYTGVASGQTTVYAQFDDMPVNAGEVCYEGSFTCPVTTGGAQATVTVDSISAALATPPVPNDANGVVAHQSFTLNIVIGGGMSAPDTGYSGTVNLSYSPALGAGETGPSSVQISGGKGSAAITLITASGTQTAPSSNRSITISAANFSPTTASLHLYWKVMMDCEARKNPGFVSCQYNSSGCAIPNGSYYCVVASGCVNATCNGKPEGYASATAFAAPPFKGMCGTGIELEASTGGGWSSLAATTVGDIGPGTTTDDYWFTGATPTMGGCLTDQLRYNLGQITSLSQCGTTGGQVLWRFQ